MDMQSVIDIMRQAFLTGLALALPALGAALLAGIVVGVFQAITSIQDQALVFVPKMLAVIAALIVFNAFMIRLIMNFTIAMIQTIPRAVQ
jgi:flagellar biosynthetic protein FliQ